MNKLHPARIFYTLTFLSIPLFFLTAVWLQQPATPPAPTGQLVDLGGQRLHVNRAGTGSPAVVVENGFGGFSVEWALVQPEVAKFTEVVTYDRAGYAWSDQRPTLDTISQTTDDLHLLLRQLGVRPPYVLVGASLGGIYVRAYLRRFPEEVAGLVLVDATHDEGIAYWINGSDKPVSHLSAEELRSVYRGLEKNPPPRPKTPAADEEPFNHLPPELRAARHWAIDKFISESFFFPKMEITAESWRQEFTASGGSGSGRLIHLVICPWSSCGTRDTNEEKQALQAQLAALSRAGKLVAAENSGHEIHLYRPDLVVQAIREVVTAVRTKQRPADRP